MVKKPAAEYAGIPLPEVEVFSNVLLGAETTEKVLNALDGIEHIRQINMTGESISKTIGSGPAKGLPNEHTERKVIKVGGRDVELCYLVGAFYIELDVENADMLDSVVVTIDKACKKTMPKGYTIGVGRFNKFRDSAHDYRND